MPAPGEGARRPRAAPQPRGDQRSAATPAPARGGRLQPAGRARGAGAAGAKRRERLLTLHVFRHLPLFPMRPSQSQSFRLHFGQHDKAAAGGVGGPCRSGSPAPGRRQHSFNSTGKKEGAAGWLLPRPPSGARLRRFRGCRQDPRAPSRLAAPEPPRNREEEAAGCRLRPRPGAPVRLGKGAAARGANARTAELRARSGGGGRPAAAAAVPLLPDGSALATRTPPSAAQRSGSAGSLSRAFSGLTLLSLLAFPLLSAPSPSPLPSRSLSGLELGSSSLPLSLRLLLSSPGRRGWEGQGEEEEEKGGE